MAGRILWFKQSGSSDGGFKINDSNTHDIDVCCVCVCVCWNVAVCDLNLLAKYVFYYIAFFLSVVGKSRIIYFACLGSYSPSSPIDDLEDFWHTHQCASFNLKDNYTKLGFFLTCFQCLG